MRQHLFSQELSFIVFVLIFNPWIIEYIFVSFLIDIEYREGEASCIFFICGWKTVRQYFSQVSLIGTFQQSISCLLWELLQPEKEAFTRISLIVTTMVVIICNFDFQVKYYITCPSRETTHVHPCTYNDFICNIAIWSIWKCFESCVGCTLSPGWVELMRKVTLSHLVNEFINAISHKWFVIWRSY